MSAVKLAEEAMQAQRGPPQIAAVALAVFAEHQRRRDAEFFAGLDVTPEEQRAIMRTPPRDFTAEQRRLRGSCMVSRRASRARSVRPRDSVEAQSFPATCDHAPGGTRTHCLRLRRPLLYPDELLAPESARSIAARSSKSQR